LLLSDVGTGPRIFFDHFGLEFPVHPRLGSEEAEKEDLYMLCGFDPPPESSGNWRKSPRGKRQLQILNFNQNRAGFEAASHVVGTRNGKM